MRTRTLTLNKHEQEHEHQRKRTRQSNSSTHSRVSTYCTRVHCSCCSVMHHHLFGLLAWMLWFGLVWCCFPSVHSMRCACSFGFVLLCFVLPCPRLLCCWVGWLVALVGWLRCFRGVPNPSWLGVGGRLRMACVYKFK